MRVIMFQRGELVYMLSLLSTCICESVLLLDFSDEYYLQHTKKFLHVDEFTWDQKHMFLITA